MLYIGLCTSANGKCCHHHNTTSGWTGCGLFWQRWPKARWCWGMMGEWEGWRGEHPGDVVWCILGMWHVFFFPFSFYFHIINFFLDTMHSFSNNHHNQTTNGQHNWTLKGAMRTSSEEMSNGNGGLETQHISSSRYVFFLFPFFYSINNHLPTGYAYPNTQCPFQMP